MLTDVHVTTCDVSGVNGGNNPTGNPYSALPLTFMSFSFGCCEAAWDSWKVMKVTKRNYSTTQTTRWTSIHFQQFYSGNVTYYIIKVACVRGDKLFCVCLSFRVLYCFLCMKVVKVKSQKSVPRGAPLSHRTHRSQGARNTSSVAPLWILNITLGLLVTHFYILHHGRSEANWRVKTWQLTGEAVSFGQACVSWPIRADWVFRKREGPLKGQELKQSVSDRGGIYCCSTVIIYLFYFFWGLKHVNLFYDNPK